MPLNDCPVNDHCPVPVHDHATENSASLAEALRSIMMTRREQENFQLIVITHDEKFANLIGTRCVADHVHQATYVHLAI